MDSSILGWVVVGIVVFSLLFGLIMKVFHDKGKSKEFEAFLKGRKQINKRSTTNKRIP